MTEAQLRLLVLALARGQGLMAHYCGDSRKCVGDRGLPDLILVGPAGILMPELKNDIGMTSANQDLWIWALTQAGIRCPVWRPEHWENRTIHAAIAALAGEKEAA